MPALNGLHPVYLFALVGGLATGLQYLLLFILVRFAGMAGPLASAIGFVVSAIFNYLANRYFTFRSQRSHQEALPRFMAVSLTGLAINTLVLWCALLALGDHILAAQLVATAVVFSWNYLVNKKWTFKVSDQIPSR